MKRFEQVCVLRKFANLFFVLLILNSETFNNFTNRQLPWRLCSHQLLFHQVKVDCFVHRYLIPSNLLLLPLPDVGAVIGIQPTSWDIEQSGGA